jgi:hypothetical protein
MKNNQTIVKIGKAGFALGTVIVSMLAGSVAYADGLHVNVDLGTPNVVVAPATFAPQDDYVYYPQYNTYYSKHQHKYAYEDNGSWVSRSAPPNVSVDTFQASPSVDMDFHDSPANHHKDVVQKYPKNWHNDRDVQKSDHSDEHSR